MSKRPTLFAPCSPELLEATQSAARRKEMTMAGFIRQAVAKALGLPADFVTYPAEIKPIAMPSKKKLARGNGGG